MSTDRFGNTYAPGLPYARGPILPGTEDDFRKCQEAWRHIAARVRTGGPMPSSTSQAWNTVYHCARTSCRLRMILSRRRSTLINSSRQLSIIWAARPTNMT